MRILGILESNIDFINQKNTNGLFIFVGIDIYGTKIFTTIESILSSQTFYYNCGKKFITDFIYEYLEDYDGKIIFVNGELCIIYKFMNGHFEILNMFESRICGKHNKGGSSSARFGRIADNIRDKYIITIIENINKLNNKSNWIFGSKDIIDDIFERKNNITIDLNDGGFLEFDKKTICDTKKWLKYIKDNIDLHDITIENIISLLDKGSNLLNFELDMIENIDLYEYIILCPKHPDYDKYENTDKIIKLELKSKFFYKMKDFVCIGKYYYENAV